MLPYHLALLWSAAALGSAAINMWPRCVQNLSTRRGQNLST
jgi:hypothetical protein